MRNSDKMISEIHPFTESGTKYDLTRIVAKISEIEEFNVLLNMDDYICTVRLHKHGDPNISAGIELDVDQKPLAMQFTAKLTQDLTNRFQEILKGAKVIVHQKDLLEFFLQQTGIQRENIQLVPEGYTIHMAKDNSEKFDPKNFTPTKGEGTSNPEAVPRTPENFLKETAPINNQYPAGSIGRPLTTKEQLDIPLPDLNNTPLDNYDSALQ